MSTVSLSLIGLFDTLDSRLECQDTFANHAVCQLAGDIVSWSKTVDLSDLESTPSNIFSQLMAIVGAGMTGKASDADGALRTMRASIPVLRKGLNNAIAKQA